jgi:hypothetical protein
VLLIDLPQIVKRKSGLESPLILEASTGFEPVIKVLQTFALPLGHDARELLIENV